MKKIFRINIIKKQNNKNKFNNNNRFNNYNHLVKLK